jgi:DNA-directed RNA polymerase specialized sigma54-like protein
MKQGALWRVLDYILKVQKNFLDSEDPAKMAPISLRKVAREVQFSPSTISRVMSTKSLLLPWDREALITYLMPGQRNVVLEILDKMLADSKHHVTDASLAKQVEEAFGVKVSRRTITACRHVLDSKHKKPRS